MTSIVGILCSDGVVIGADGAATFFHENYPTIKQLSEKIAIISDEIIVAGTGSVGLDQRFCEIIKVAWNQIPANFELNPIIVTTSLARSFRDNMKLTHKEPGDYGALVAFPAMNDFFLCEFGITDFQPELKTDDIWFGSMGSAQPITDSFLAFMRKIFWSDEKPTVNAATFAVTWTLEHAIEVSPQFVDKPIQIAVLEEDIDGRLKARTLRYDELDEHRQYIETVKSHMREFRHSISRQEEIDLPTLNETKSDTV